MYCLTFYINTGDIVLIRGGAKHSKLIAAVTKGPFSHACLVVGGSQIIEALGGSGVQYTSALKFLLSDMSNVAVLRPKLLCGDQANHIRARLEDVAKGFQSRDYNYEDAVKSVLNRRQPSDKDKFFCSQLVSAIYRAAGFPLTNKKDHNVTPNDFHKNTHLFENITDHCLATLPESLVEIAEDLQKAPIDSGGETVSDTALLFQTFRKGAGRVFEKFGFAAPKDMWGIIDVLTDPANSAIAAQVDGEVTEVFDSLDIIDKLTPPGEDNELNAAAIFDELERRGLPHAQYQLAVTTKSVEGLKEKRGKTEEYLKAYSAAAAGIGLNYAGRMCDYYAFLIRTSLSLEKVLVEKINILEQYQKTCESRSVAS